MKTLRKTFFSVLMVLFAVQAFAQNYAAEYDKLRTVVYNDVTSTESAVVEAYNNANKYVSNEVEGAQIDYLIGLFYMNNDDKENAGKYYNQALAKAKSSFEAKPNAAAYTIYTETLSQNCTVQGGSYMVSNGTKVPSWAKKALALDPKMAGASYMLACYSIYAPAPFCNLGKGTKILQSTINSSNLEVDDLFNYYSTFGYVELKKKNYEKADEWLAKAAEIYPNNKNLKMLQRHEFKSYGEDVDTSAVNAAE